MDGFNPRAPRGARPSLCVSASTWPRFQSACPARGTTSTVSAWWNAVGVSIRVPRAGHDAPAWERPMSSARFNPRAPRGARLPQLPSPVGSMSFNPRAPRGARPGADGRSLRKNCFNPRAPRGARPLGSGLSGRSEMVSIRVPRAGHDLLRRHARRARNRFNPRAPRGARRPRAGHAVAVEVFQSACPARGTTLFFCVSGMGLQVSIRVPRAGHDTQPLGHRSWPGVSIRVPRAGHDLRHATAAKGVTRFNPRAPRGARREAFEAINAEQSFQSACPARGTTGDRHGYRQAGRVSIRVPRAGHDELEQQLKAHFLFQSACPARGTTRRSDCGARTRCFNPRAPRGARPSPRCRVQPCGGVSIRVPRAGHDSAGRPSRPRPKFQSACPARGTTISR